MMYTTEVETTVDIGEESVDVVLAVVANVEIEECSDLPRTELVDIHKVRLFSGWHDEKEVILNLTDGNYDGIRYQIIQNFLNEK